MPATAAPRKPPAEIDKTAARRFPLVHKLIHFADLRHFYRDMREALITANRSAGAQQGLVTKAKRKIAELEAELNLLEKERADLLAYRQQVEQQERANGGPSRQSSEDLHRAIERLLERADAVLTCWRWPAAMARPTCELMAPSPQGRNTTAASLTCWST
ncbi:MAG: hypothetical protein ACK550_07035 [Synechococcaceae cyanobacterium]